MLDTRPGDLTVPDGRSAPVEPLGPVETPEPGIVDIPEPDVVDVPEPDVVEVPEPSDVAGSLRRGESKHREDPRNKGSRQRHRRRPWRRPVPEVG